MGYSLCHLVSSYFATFCLIQPCYSHLVSDLWEDLHGGLQHGLSKCILHLFIVLTTFLNLLVFPLLKPLIGGEGECSECGFSWDINKKEQSVL